MRTNKIGYPAVRDRVVGEIAGTRFYGEVIVTLPHQLDPKARVAFIQFERPIEWDGCAAPRGYLCSTFEASPTPDGRWICDDGAWFELAKRS